MSEAELHPLLVSFQWPVTFDIVYFLKMYLLICKLSEIISGSSSTIRKLTPRVRCGDTEPQRFHHRCVSGGCALEARDTFRCNSLPPHCELVSETNTIMFSEESIDFEI